MRIQITTRAGHVPEDVMERTESLVGGLTKFDPRVSAADVIFNEEKNAQQIEVILHVDGTPPVVAHGEEPEFRVALDKTVDKLARMLRRQRERDRDHKADPRP